VAAYRRVYDSRYLQAGCQEEPGSAPEPYTLGNRVWAIFTFFTVWGMWKEAPMPKTRSIRPVVSIQHRPVTVGHATTAHAALVYRRRAVKVVVACRSAVRLCTAR